MRWSKCPLRTYRVATVVTLSSFKREGPPYEALCFHPSARPCNPLCFAQAVIHSQNTQSQIPDQTPLTAGQPLDLERQVPRICGVRSISSAPRSTPSSLPAGGNSQSDSASLDLTFRNAADKKIKSAALKVQVKSKKSIYDLDACTVTTHLEISGIDVTSSQCPGDSPCPCLHLGSHR